MGMSNTILSTIRSCHEESLKNEVNTITLYDWVSSMRKEASEKKQNQDQTIHKARQGPCQHNRPSPGLIIHTPHRERNAQP